MKARRALSDDQERLRIEGLRILARIIARHALAGADPGTGRSPERIARSTARRTPERPGADPKGAA